MRANRQRAGKDRPAWLALLFCALLLRAFIPGGYMIGSAANGAPALVICPDAAPAAHGEHHGKAPGKHRDSPCPFGLLGTPALPANPPLLAAFVPPPLALAPAFAPPRFRALPAAAPPPSTGPPVSARS